MGGIGQLAIPIPVVGALIGGFVGITMSKTFYDISLKTLKEAKEAHQDRIKDEKKCRENIRQLEMYRNQFKEVFERYFHGNMKFFNESFDELERALYAGDADLVIGANNKIQEGLGQKVLFGNKQECWEFITIRDIAQTISLIHRHEDRLDGSDLAREEKKAVRAELQKSIDENLEALKKIINI
ncbi:hypothetical protein HpCHN10_08690 [Helicobacter pylori]